MKEYSPDRKSGKRPSALRSNRHREADFLDNKRAILGGGLKAMSGGGGIFKSAAVAVLRQERKLMTTGDITRIALERGLVKCTGKTPEATMASALYTDVKRKHDKSVFTRPQEGLFGLREWIDEGFFPEGWEGPPDGLGLAPFKKRVPNLSKSRLPLGRHSKARAMATWKGNSSDFDEDEELLDEDEELDTGEGEDEDELTEGEESDSDLTPSQHGQQHERRARHRSSSRGQEQDDDVDDLESPLHVLGSVALSKSAEREWEEPGGSGNRKRGSGIGGEAPTPKSPFEDTLAALHEIATSPLSYAADLVKEEQARKRKRQLNVDMLHDDDRGVGASRQHHLTSAAMFHGLNELPVSPLQNGHAHPLGNSRNKLSLNIAGLSSPQAFLDALNTPDLLSLSLPLPEALPSTPDMIAAALQSTGVQGLGKLFSPTGLLQGLTPRPGTLGHHLGTSFIKNEGPSGATILEPLVPTSQLHHLINGSTLPSTSGMVLPRAPVVNGVSGPLQPPKLGPKAELGKLTPQQIEAELVEVAKVQAVVERLESKLGQNHPQVGKAWLSLARMYEHIGESGPVGMEKAAAALQRAWNACRSCAESCGAAIKCEHSFLYLKDRFSKGGGKMQAV